MEWVNEYVLDPFRFDFMRRALAAAGLLGISGGLLGSLLLLRRLSLMSDALAHSLLPGIGLAYLLFGSNPFSLFTGALIAGLVTSFGSALVTRLTRIKEEAAFAAWFIVLFGAGVSLVSAMNARVDLMHFLFGNILSVNATDLWIAAGSSVLTVTAFLLFYRALLLESFDRVFYRAIGGAGTWLHFGVLTLTTVNLVAALQTMGVVLAPGLFILPAVSAYLWTDRLSLLLLLSTLFALLGAAVGLLVSYHAGLATGAAIVLVLGGWFMFSALTSPRYGVVVRLVRAAREGHGVTHAPH